MTGNKQFRRKRFDDVSYFLGETWIARPCRARRSSWTAWTKRREGHYLYQMLGESTSPRRN